MQLRTYNKKPTPKDLSEAIVDFMGAWCLHCDVGQTMNPDIDHSTLTIPCPKETWDTCPILLTYKSYQEKKGAFDDLLRSTNKDTDSSPSRLSDI